MAKNPYTLLGVKKTASDAEIRKAYRAMAKKLHPDVNPGDKKAEEKFKEATAAYNLLSDKEMRKRYDSGQVDSSGQQQNPFGGMGGGFGGGGFGGGANPFGSGRRPRAGGQDDMAELFSSLFGMNSANMRGGMQPRPAKGGDILYKLTLSLPEALIGGMRTIDKGLSIKLPKGVKDGQVLRLKGKGQSGQYGGPNGDAKVEIKLRSHKYLSRKGDDLHLTLPITLHEALNGAKVKIDMPGGAVSLNLPAGTNSGKKLRLKGKGVGSADLVVMPVITLSDTELAKKTEILEKIPENNAIGLRSNMF